MQTECFGAADIFIEDTNIGRIHVEGINLEDSHSARDAIRVITFNCRQRHSVEKFQRDHDRKISILTL